MVAEIWISKICSRNNMMNHLQNHLMVIDDQQDESTTSLDDHWQAAFGFTLISVTIAEIWQVESRWSLIFLMIIDHHWCSLMLIDDDHWWSLMINKMNHQQVLMIIDNLHLDSCWYHLPLLRNLKFIFAQFSKKLIMSEGSSLILKFSKFRPRNLPRPRRLRRNYGSISLGSQTKNWKIICDHMQLVSDRSEQPFWRYSFLPNFT